MSTCPQCPSHCLVMTAFWSERYTIHYCLYCFLPLFQKEQLVLTTVYTVQNVTSVALKLKYIRKIIQRQIIKQTNKHKILYEQHSICPNQQQSKEICRTSSYELYKILRMGKLPNFSSSEGGNSWRSVDVCLRSGPSRDSQEKSKEVVRWLMREGCWKSRALLHKCELIFWEISLNFALMCNAEEF